MSPNCDSPWMSGPATRSLLPPSPTERLLSWLERLDGGLSYARASRTRDLRREAMLVEARRAAVRQLEEMRSARRRRWRDVSRSRMTVEASEEGIRFDAFFREMDAALSRKKREQEEDSDEGQEPKRPRKEGDDVALSEP